MDKKEFHKYSQIIFCRVLCYRNGIFFIFWERIRSFCFAVAIILRNKKKTIFLKWSTKCIDNRQQYSVYLFHFSFELRNLILLFVIVSRSFFMYIGGLLNHAVVCCLSACLLILQCLVIFLLNSEKSKTTHLYLNWKNKYLKVITSIEYRFLSIITYVCV